MLNMKFTKEKVLTTLSNNLEEHRRIFEEAVDGYYEAALKELNKAIERLQEPSGPTSVYVTVSAPENHEKDYEAVISMLENSLDTEIVFNDIQYRCYMLDEWDWQRKFLASNSKYSTLAATKAGSI